MSTLRPKWNKAFFGKSEALTNDQFNLLISTKLSHYRKATKKLPRVSSLALQCERAGSAESSGWLWGVKTLALRCEISLLALSLFPLTKARIIHILNTFIMPDFKFVRRVNPVKRSDPAKWYAIPAGRKMLEADEVAGAATLNTTISKGEMKASFEALSEVAPGMLDQGFTIKLGDLGHIALSFGSTGVDNIADFDAATMIKNPKIIFTPSKKLKEAIKQASYRNVGVVENGFTYASVKDYQKFQVSARPGEGGGEGGGDDVLE